MTGKSKQLSGSNKDRYLERLIREAGLPAEVAEQLAAKAKSQISSVRVRRDEVLDLRPTRGRAAPSQEPATLDEVLTEASETEAAETDEADTAAAKPFDPYAFGLVPVYQREGRDGLLAQLTNVTDAGHLRLMAQKQQISLRAELRSGDIALADLREAIVAAVEKRIADRRAAAS